MLEKHRQDHLENKEQEDREHEQMVADMTVIRVKRRVPAEKEDKQVADIHGEGQRRQPAEEVKGGEEVFALTPKSKEASMATYAGDCGVKRSLVDTMLRASASTAAI